MGAGASSCCLSAAIESASDEDISAALRSLSSENFQKIATAIRADVNEPSLKQKMKLHGTGYGSQMRFMLALASERGEAEWEDLCYSWKTFQNVLKPKGMQMPSLELADGTSVTGMFEIAELIAKQYGFWPDEGSDQGKELGKACDRLMKEFGSFTFAFMKPLIAPSAEESEAEMKSLLETSLPQYIAKVEETLEKNGTTFLLADDKLYCCDFFAAKFYVDNITNKHCPLSKLCGDILDAHPRFKAYGEAFAAANKAYLENGGLVNPDALP